jgi:ketosteroid isomerase-like protein
MGAEDVMHAYVTAVQAGDRPAAFALFADDVVGHVPGRSPVAGVKRGKDAVVGYIEDAFARSHGDVTVELVDMLVGREHMALVVRERLADGDRVLDMRRTNVYRVRDDRITEVWIFEGDQYAVDEWFGQADAPE